MAGIPYTDQNHLHGQWREFRILDNAQKTKENDVKMISPSMAYITLIRLLFCISKGEREREREREVFSKKKNSKLVRNNFTVK